MKDKRSRGENQVKVPDKPKEKEFREGVSGLQNHYIQRAQVL